MDYSNVSGLGREGVDAKAGDSQGNDQELSDTFVLHGVTLETSELADKIREELRSEMQQELQEEQRSNQFPNDENDIGVDGRATETWQTEKPPFWRTRCFLLIAIIILVSVICGIFGGVLASRSSQSDQTSDNDVQQTPIPSSAEQPTLQPTAAPVINSTLPPAQFSLKASLVGDYNNSRFGADVSFSRNGKRIAVGANNANYVQAFEDAGSKWEQMGQRIFGDGGGFGSSLAMNEDGSVMAVGAWGLDGPGNGAGQAKIFQYDGTTWNQLGQNLHGDTPEDGFGWDVALSNDGKTLVVSALWGDLSNILENEGYVRVYSLVGNSWVPKGRNIVGVESNGEFGRSVAVSSAGDRIAVGAKLAGDLDQGEVKVFDFLKGQWNQVGKALLGEEEGDYLGSSVAISSAGSILATAADGSDKNGENAGLVRAYRLVDDAWKQHGEDIVGECCSGVLGAGHISLSSNGLTIAAGAQRLHDDAGKAYVYRLNNSTWEQVLAISGDKGDYFGSSVALSGDGSLLVVGAPSDDSIGYVHIYSLS